MNAAVADALDARYDTTDMARQDTVLSPHFYTTDFDAWTASTWSRCAPTGTA